MFERVVVFADFVHQRVSPSVVAHLFVVALQIDVAQVGERVLHGVVFRLVVGVYYALSRGGVARSGGYADAYCLAVVERSEVVPLAEVRLNLAEALLRATYAVHVQIDVGEVHLALVHVEVVLHAVALYGVLHAQEHLERLRVVLQKIVVVAEVV